MCSQSSTRVRRVQQFWQLSLHERHIQATFQCNHLVADSLLEQRTFMKAEDQVCLPRTPNVVRDVQGRLMTYQVFDRVIGCSGGNGIGWCGWLIVDPATMLASASR